MGPRLNSLNRLPHLPVLKPPSQMLKQHPTGVLCQSKQPGKIYDNGSTRSLPTHRNKKVRRIFDLVLVGSRMLPRLGFILPVKNKQARLRESLQSGSSAGPGSPPHTPGERQAQRWKQTQMEPEVEPNTLERDTGTLFSFSDRSSKEGSMDHVSICDI